MTRARWSAALAIGVALVGGGALWLGSGGEEAPERERRKRRGEAMRVLTAEDRDAPVWHRAEIEGERPVPPAGAPNVVLVIGCTVRRDQLTPYGGLPHATPFLAEWAAAGAAFDDALSTSSWTRESSVGLLTGQHAASLGMVEPGEAHSRRVLPEDVTTVAELLRDHGWTTLGVTANPNLNLEFGFAQGFDAYRDSRGFAKGHLMTGPVVVDAALELLDDRRLTDRPVFLQVLFIDPHTPRRPEPEYVARFAEPGVSEKLVAYRALLRRLDDQLRALTEALAARGIEPDNSLFVFVADHGEGLSHPPHHTPGHGKRLVHSMVGIPWLVRGPGVPAGHRIPGLASGVDLLPTLAGLLDLPVPEGVVGFDHTVEVRGAAGPTARERAYSLTMFLRADLAATWTTERQCQSGYGRDATTIRRGCFDRVVDPDFHHLIRSEEGPARVDAWREARLREGAERAVSDHDASDDLEAQLEALGYVE